MELMEPEDHLVLMYVLICFDQYYHILQGTKGDNGEKGNQGLRGARGKPGPPVSILTIIPVIYFLMMSG